MVKYRKTIKGYGRSKYPKVEPVRGKEIKELEDSGVKLYDTRQEANEGSC